MNYREDLEIKLQKVTLAMQEVVDDIHKTDSEKQRIISKLIGLGEFLHSSKKIILLPSGFSRHPLGLLVLQPNKYLGSMLFT